MLSGKSLTKACRLCGKNQKLIKAHSIPEAFFRELRVDDQAPLLVSGKLGHFPKKAPIGIYDEAILCDVCEPTFGAADSYGIDVFLKRFDEHFHPVQQGGNVAGFESNSVDPNRLLQFLVSVLWRASVSSHVFYSKVALGPHEDAAREASDISLNSMSPVFDAVLSRWRSQDGGDLPTTAMLDPRREKWFGINAYRLYFGETIAYVKVDAQPFPAKMRNLSLRSAPPVLVVAREMKESKDLRALKHTAKRSHENAAKFRVAHGVR